MFTGELEIHPEQETSLDQVILWVSGTAEDVAMINRLTDLGLEFDIRVVDNESRNTPFETPTLQSLVFRYYGPVLREFVYHTSLEHAKENKYEVLISGTAEDVAMINRLTDLGLEFEIKVADIKSIGELVTPILKSPSLPLPLSGSNLTKFIRPFGISITEEVEKDRVHYMKRVELEKSGVHLDWPSWSVRYHPKNDRQSTDNFPTITPKKFLIKGELISLLN